MEFNFIADFAVSKVYLQGNYLFSLFESDNPRPVTKLRLSVRHRATHSHGAPANPQHLLKRHCAVIVPCVPEQARGGCRLESRWARLTLDVWRVEDCFLRSLHTSVQRNLPKSQGTLYTVDAMPSRASKLKSRPRDVNLLARSVVEDLIGERFDGSPLPSEPERTKNPAAVALSKLGAAKGGRARAEALSARRRKAIAKKAADARWKSGQ